MEVVHVRVQPPSLELVTQQAVQVCIFICENVWGFDKSKISSESKIF